MDDGFILNLTSDLNSSAKAGSSKKGGRWTDRLKSKRVAKRKVQIDESHDKSGEPEHTPKKKTRTDASTSNDFSTKKATASTERTASSSRPTQIVSSLFTSNPEVQQPSPNSRPRTIYKPSNAPLADSSTFTGLGLDPLISTHLSTKMTIMNPTSIQRAALPALLSTSGEDTSTKDVFIQSQTGSGKTLSFLLPIIQDLLPLSSQSYIDRSIGTLAIIIAPTRELAKQISDVLELLLQLRLRPPEEGPDVDSSGPRLTRWLVSGLLTGGSTRTHEKARLRKGCPVLVSTPGRLLDHLQNTSSFNVGKCRWLVLDEADRLMELGFEDTIQGIVKGLEGRRKLAMKAVEEGKSMEVGGWDWDRRRRTVLCSATIREDVQKLAGTALIDPIMVKAVPDEDNKLLFGQSSSTSPAHGNVRFTPPSQLSQKYVVVPLKLRLVTLVALLRSLIGQSQARRGTKIIVFLSCTDSVDFHWQLLGGAMMSSGDANSGSETESPQKSDDNGILNLSDDPSRAMAAADNVAMMSPLLPDTSVYRLHGSLPLQTRLASLRGFSAAYTDKPSSPISSVLLCTSVASRGLDLPLVRAVIQYDLPTEGGSTEYVHRVGRTARVGKGGEAWSFVAPSEVDWVSWVTEKMQGSPAESETENKSPTKLEAVATETVLKNGFGGKGTEYEERATDVQLSFERWVLRNQRHASMARKAYLSHMRAYATHPSDEKHIFHIRHLHLGHLAKTFALRDAPTTVSSAKNKSTGPGSVDHSRRRLRHGDWDGAKQIQDVEQRMEEVVRAQGRLTKKAGRMVSSGVSEFQIASGYDLEKLG